MRVDLNVTEDLNMAVDPNVRVNLNVRVDLSVGVLTEQRPSSPNKVAVFSGTREAAGRGRQRQR